MDSVETKDGRYQEPQISQTVVGNLGTSEDFGAVTKPGHYVSGLESRGKLQEAWIQLEVESQEARAMTATPVQS